MDMNKILSHIGIEPDNKNGFFWIWLPFVTSVFSIFSITLLLFWLYPVKDINDKTNIHQSLFIITLIIISNLLVATNTTIFVVKGWKLPVQPKKNDNSQLLVGLPKYNLYNIITLVLAVVILCSFIFSDYSLSKTGKLDWMVFSVNIASILIFSLFCFADDIYIRYLENCLRVEVNHKGKFEIQIDVMKRAFVLIDLAGVVGICIIFFMSIIFSTFFDNRFIQGFGIGALAFHIIFTQFNWAYLKTDELKKLAQI